MQDITYVSENYSSNKSKDYRLSISVRRDGFSFLLVHKRTQEVMAYAYNIVPPDYRNEGFKQFLNQKIFQETFGAVTIIIVSPNFTLVPKKFYDDTLLQDYSQLNFEKSESESIITYESFNTDAVVLFPIDTTIWALCRTAFRNQEMVSYVPQVAPMIESGVKKREEKLMISVENDFFTAVYVRSKELRFANTFSFSNIDDFTYYIMNIVQQLQLDVLQVAIEMSGKITPKSPYFSAIQTYVKNVRMAENPVKLPRFPYMLFLNHCNISLCE